MTYRSDVADLPANVRAWLDRRNYRMGLDDLEEARRWMLAAARDLARLRDEVAELRDEVAELRAAAQVAEPMP